MMDWSWPELDFLEREERWNEAKAFLLEEFQQNPRDLKTITRLGFFCWYVLVEETHLGITEVDLNELETVLKKVTHIGYTLYPTNSDFLWCFGYMISTFPFYFGEFEHWEKKGLSMLKSAYKLCPDDPVYKYTYLGSCSSNIREYKRVKKLLQAVLESRFQGEGLVSTYFKSVWSN